VWPWIGVALAGVIAAPNIAWQAANGWPQFEMSEAIAARSGGPAAFILEQLGLLSIVLVAPAAIGWWRLWRSDRFRPIAVAYGLLFVVFLVTGGKSYYVAPMYIAFVPAGMGWVDSLENRRFRTALGVGSVGLVIGAFVGLPLLPVSAVASFDPTGELGETAGWPEFVAQVAAVRDDLGPDAVVFTASYGEAGAIDLLGGDLGLDRAWSGHNSYWSWGPPPAHGAVVTVGNVGDAVRAICAAWDESATISNPWDIPNEENGLPIRVCTTPSRQLADIWVSVRHYN
jgi:hypothetical protein